MDSMQQLQSRPRTKATTFKEKGESLRDMFAFNMRSDHMPSHSLVVPAAIAAPANVAPTRSLLRRLYDAIVAQQHARAEREVARYLRIHRDRFTDALEREIERRFPEY
jgi:hypothetical protein